MFGKGYDKFHEYTCEESERIAWTSPMAILRSSCAGHAGLDVKLGIIDL